MHICSAVCLTPAPALSSRVAQLHGEHHRAKGLLRLSTARGQREWRLIGPLRRRTVVWGSPWGSSTKMNNELSSKQIVYGSRRQYVERAPNLGMGHHGQHKCWSISKRPEHIKPRRRGNAARTRYCTPSTRRRPSTAPAGGRASLETNATLVTASARPSTAGARRPTCLFGATRASMMKKEHSHKFMTLKGSSLGHSNDLSLFERKAMETQMFRKAQEAKARAKALAGLDWKNHVLEKCAGCWIWMDYKSGMANPVEEVLPPGTKPGILRGEFHKHHDDPNKPPTPRKPPKDREAAAIWAHLTRRLSFSEARAHQALGALRGAASLSGALDWLCVRLDEVAHERGRLVVGRERRGRYVLREERGHVGAASHEPVARVAAFGLLWRRRGGRIPLWRR